MIIARGIIKLAITAKASVIPEFKRCLKMLGHTKITNTSKYIRISDFIPQFKELSIVIKSLYTGQVD